MVLRVCGIHPEGSGDAVIAARAQLEGEVPLFSRSDCKVSHFGAEPGNHGLATAKATYIY